MTEITLASGPTLHDCQNRLLAFCANEYPYYDAIPDSAPNQILPIDVLVTVSMNSRVSTGERVQTVHRGMAQACDGLLKSIPVDADLLQFDPDLAVGEQLLSAAMAMKGVGPAVATKVLHRKRRNFIPMLDSVVLLFYLDALGKRSPMEGRLIDKGRAIEPTMLAWRAFRDDLRSASKEIDGLVGRAAERRFEMSRVRVLEVLIWMEAEDRGYYRPEVEAESSAELQ